MVVADPFLYLPLLDSSCKKNVIFMTDNDTIPLIAHTMALLDSGCYKDCFALLRRRLAELPMAGALSRLNAAESTYRYMLQYFQQGFADPGRQKVVSDIRRELMDIAQTLHRESKVSDSSGLYYSTLRMVRMRPLDVADTLEAITRKDAMASLAVSAGSYPAAVFSEIEQLESRLFDAFWVNDSIPENVWRETSAKLTDGSLPFTTAALVISAAGLGLMSCYSFGALSLLCDAVDSSDVRLSARAAVELVIGLSRWNYRIADDTRLINRLEALVDNPGTVRNLRNVVFTLLRTRDTDRISRKMQKDVIPGLMQFGPDIIRRMKEATKESSLEDMEANPEWEDLLKNSGLDEKLRELSEMQSDGADVMMVAFSNLKGFPFFRQIRNWMMPFSLQHSMLNALSASGDESVSSLLEVNGMMCDSDKYSFAFSLASMPEAQRSMVMGQMQGQMEQVREQMKELEALKAGHEFDDEAVRFSRDLYRFHKLFPRRAEFPDPFGAFVSPADLPVLGGLFCNEEDALALADFFFKRAYYSDALPHLEELTSSSADTPHLWEKIGFCYEKVDSDPQKAVEAYMKAQLFNPDSRWISRRLGLCYRRMGDFTNAVDYLRMSLGDDAKFDRRMSLMIADTLIDAENWAEALKELYRVDYETPGDTEVVRRMAVCAFRGADLDKACDLYKSIPQLELSEDDYRYMGHIAFLQGRIPDAMRLYRKTVRPNDKGALWKTAINADLPILRSFGVSDTDLPLLLESIAYHLES